MSALDPWAGFDHDPRERHNAALRASDADRERVRQLLGDAFAEGRLDRDELDERTDAVATARLLGDLPPIVADLVPMHPALRQPSGGLVGLGRAELQARAVETWEADRRRAALSFVGVSLVCWAVWTAVSMGGGGFDPSFPWPLIVSAALLANLVRVSATRAEAIRTELARLERKQAKQLRTRRWKSDGGP